MAKHGLVVLLVCALSLTFGTGQGCIPPAGDGDNGGGDNGGGDNGGGDNGGGDSGGGDSSTLGVVLTSIGVHVQGRISCGDDIIAYTATASDGTANGVDYIIPGAADTSGRGITGGSDYNDESFVATGKKIALVGGPSSDDTFKVSIYDTDTTTISEIALTDVRVATIPVDAFGAGHIVADGDYVATRNDPSSVDDGNIVKVIDVSGSTPSVISFPNPDGVSTGFQVPQVLVDADTQTVVAVTSSSFYVYDITNPTGTPTQYDVSGSGGIAADSTPFAYDNGMILYIDDTVDENTYYIDVTSASNTPVQLSQEADSTSTRLALWGTAYGYLWNTPASMGLAAAIGEIPNTSPTLADTTDASLIQENSANQGRYGYGATLAIGSLNGTATYFIAGSESVGTPDPLQYSSTGGLNWTLVADPNDPDDALKASDVVTDSSGVYLGFKHGIDTDTMLAYAILN